MSFDVIECPDCKRGLYFKDRCSTVYECLLSSLNYPPHTHTVPLTLRGGVKVLVGIEVVVSVVVVSEDAMLHDDPPEVGSEVTWVHDHHTEAIIRTIKCHVNILM